MKFFDIIILILLLWGAYKGFKNGLIKQIISMVSIILGIYIASKFCLSFSQIIGIDSEYKKIIAFSILFVGVLFLAYIISRIFDAIIKATSLGLINRLLGAVFGLLVYWVILLVVVIIINKINRVEHFISNEFFESSLLYEPLSKCAQQVYDWFY